MATDETPTGVFGATTKRPSEDSASDLRLWRGRNRTHESVDPVGQKLRVPVEQVLFDIGPVASALPKGQHLWILRLPARRYAWYRIDLGSQAGVDEEYLVSHDGLSDENEFEFDVLPGIINYPGELIIRTDAFFRSSGKVWVRNRNHSAMAIRRLGFPATGSFRGSVL